MRPCFLVTKYDKHRIARSTCFDSLTRHVFPPALELDVFFLDVVSQSLLHAGTLSRALPAFFMLSLASNAFCFEANLAGMEGFPNLVGVSIGSDGTVDPFSQLFRANFVGVGTGPFVSQVR